MPLIADSVMQRCVVATMPNGTQVWIDEPDAEGFLERFARQERHGDTWLRGRDGSVIQTRHIARLHLDWIALKPGEWTADVSDS